MLFKKITVFSLILFTSCIAPVALLAATPELSQVPAGHAQETTLLRERDLLESQMRDIMASVEANKVRCGSVESGSALETDCREEGKRIKHRYIELVEKYKAFNDRVRQSPQKKTITSAVARFEARGEYYFLTNDGRKLTGNDANQVPMEEGTKVVTGSSGHVRMVLPDNTVFTVGPHSNLVIDKFIYDDDHSAKTIIANLSRGVFRWVTGKVIRKDPSEMKVIVPLIAIGIRGTDFETTINPDGTGRVMLYFGQLEIIERKTGFTFMLNQGEKIMFGADGIISRPMKSDTQIISEK